tara:strand:+ start:1239 stop:1511 length:273 start_codon:yes stop_codon:yes gene_type:complete
MGFIFGGNKKSQESVKAEADANESVKKQEQIVEQQEASEKRKTAAKQRAILSGSSMRALVSQEREDPLLGNPDMPLQNKLGPKRNPKGLS